MLENIGNKFPKGQTKAKSMTPTPDEESEP